EEMQKQYWQAQPVSSCAFLGNTGDGVRMAQAVGADLWHMWHFHGTYGFKTEDYPLGIRTKRLPDWYPSKDGGVTFASMFADSRAVKMPWILLDQDGKRFMNEYEPYMQDTGHRAFESYSPERQMFPRIPCWLIADEAGRTRFPWGQPLYNDREVEFSWSADNSAEIERGIIQRADSLGDLAALMDVASDTLLSTVERWNAGVSEESDQDFSRPPTSMLPVSEPPFYCAQVWPIVSNTQGGPVHDARQRVLDPFGEPIDGLYAAGELGSVFGHLYLSGGNVSECFIGGRIAGREAAQANSL
ncbi:MAG: FAD-binding protein, partial [Chromatiales bacterium]|nr:FAD-binding protein [Chromatiales bacterium]